MDFFSPSSVSLFPQLIVDFLRLLLALIWVILGMRIVWRVEKKLDVFFKFMTWAGILIFARQFFRVLQSLEILQQGAWLSLLDLIPTVLIIWALVVMDSVITKLDREKER